MDWAHVGRELLKKSPTDVVEALCEDGSLIVALRAAVQPAPAPSDEVAELREALGRIMEHLRGDEIDRHWIEDVVMAALANVKAVG